MRVSVVTKDKYLFRIFELKLSKKATVTMGFNPDADVIIHDCDTEADITISDARIFKVSRNPATDTLTLPLSHTFFEDILSEAKTKPAISLSSDGKHAFVRGESVKLTAHEYSLLSLLISGGENYTPRSVIASKVWNGASDSLVNVYIHYLREKLETDGEKVILSSRKYGYKLNPIYINSEDKSVGCTDEEGVLL